MMDKDQPAASKPLPDVSPSVVDHRDAPVALWKDPVILSILAAALAARVYLAIAGPLFHDEEYTFIPCVKQISVLPGHVYLPIRVHQHAALPCYLHRAGSLIFGDVPFGYRFASLMMGMGTIILTCRVAVELGGLAAARWTALLLAFNEYHMAASAIATELSPQMFFVALAMYGFAQFLKTERAWGLYVAGVAAGCGFLCKEVASLMLLVFLLALLLSPCRRWLLRYQPWLAAGLFLLVISPDIWHNATTSVEGKSSHYANYADHFSRIAGLGVNSQQTLFYLRDVLKLLGLPFEAGFAEMPTMNLAFGVLLLVGPVFALFRRPVGLQAVFLLLMFWGIFGFFVLTPTQWPSRDIALDDKVFHAADITLLPAVLLTSLMLSKLPGRWRIGSWLAAALVVLYVGMAMWTNNLRTPPGVCGDSAKVGAPGAWCGTCAEGCRRLSIPLALKR